MELRQLFTIVVRRWWLVLLPALVVAVISLRSVGTLLNPPVLYTTSVRFTVGQPPLDGVTNYDPRYYSWLASEFITRGLQDWSRGRTFAELVSADLFTRHARTLSTDAVHELMAADSTRSVVVLYANGNDPALVQDLMDSAMHVLMEQNVHAFPQLRPSGALVTPLDTVAITSSAPSLRDRLDLPLRIALGLAAGLALAFIVEYLDPTVRARHELEALGLTVVGEIPPRRPSPSPPKRP